MKLKIILLLISFIVFLGVVIYNYSPKRKQKNKEIANKILQDDD